MNDGEPLHVVSLSGGKDSTAMLLMMTKRGMRVDEAVYFDTGWEFPAMHDHLDLVEERAGIAITRFGPDKPFDYWMFDHVRTRGDHKGEAGYGWARPNARWCTKLKTTAIDKHIASISQGGEVVQYIGIAADEPHRIRDKRYPLAEWGVTEAAALEYCYAHGYDWGGLYEHFPRVSCWCCPLKSLPELRKLRHEFPELWARLREMDARAWNSFRIDYSVDQLERRFALEDAQTVMDFGGGSYDWPVD